MMEGTWLPIPKRSTSPEADIDTAAVDSLTTLDPNTAD